MEIGFRLIGDWWEIGLRLVGKIGFVSMRVFFLFFKKSHDIIITISQLITTTNTNLKSKMDSPCFR